MPLPVLFSDSWTQTAKHVGEYLPGTPKHVELLRYNTMLNEPLKLIDYDKHTTLFLVAEPPTVSRKDVMFNIYACQTDSPTHVAPLVPLRSPAGDPLALTEDNLAYAMNTLMYFGPFGAITAEQKQTLYKKWTDESQASYDAKRKAVAEEYVELSKEVATANLNHPLVQEEAIKKGLKKTYAARTTPSKED